MGKTKQGFQRLPIRDTSPMPDNALSVLAFFVAVILDNLDPDIIGSGES
ncbi:MAG: hypothetical protein OXH01_06445 [Bacteroidetes bacterium]|nr:hypothetical protein [Bacteroidota bacterium]